MSHLLQARGTLSSFGRIQSAARRGIRKRASNCVQSGRQLDQLHLMDCVHKAAGDTFTPTNLAAAFRRVGIWPLDPTCVPVEAMSQGAALPVVDVDL